MRKAMQGAWGSYIVPYGRMLEVDYSHPLTRGMTVCIIPGSQYRLADMLGFAPPLVSSTNGKLISSRAGVGVASNVNSPAGAQSAAQSLAYLVPAGGMTLGYLGSATATSSGQASNQTLWGIDNSTTSRVGIKAGVGVGVAWIAHWKNVNSLQAQTLTGTPYGAPNVGACACSFAWGGGTGGWATATPSGALNTGTYTTTGTPTMGTDVLCLGSGTVNGFPSLITSLAGVIWNRVLSADELQMFALAPMDFVKVVPRRTYHYISPNGTAFITGSAATGASGTLTNVATATDIGTGSSGTVGALSFDTFRLLFAESFDIYASSVDLISNYLTATGGAFVTNTAIGTGQAISGSLSLNGVWYDGTNQGFVCVSLLLRYDSTVANFGDTVSLTLQDDSTNQVCIVWAGDGSITVRTGGSSGTILQTISNAFQINVWDSWQISFAIDTSGSVKLYKNGAITSIVPTISGDTRGGSSNSFANRFLLEANSSSWLIDDLFINGGATGAGDVRGIQQVPDTDVSVQLGSTETSNYAAVDDLTADSDTSYVSAAIVGQEDQYGMTALPVTPNAIVGVQYYVFEKKRTQA